jgi:nucleotide-binding universal stress UspA family protein
MTPKTILACLTTEAAAPTLARAGAELATRWDARLVGLLSIESLVVYPTFAIELPTVVYETIGNTQKERTKVMKAAFEENTRGLDVPPEFRLLAADAVAASDRMVESARAADLVLIGSAVQASDRYDIRYAQEDVIRRSGRPVIVLPEGAEAPRGEKAVIGWRDTPEATRALHDVLPLLKPGAEVRLLEIASKRQLGDRGDVMTDVAAAVARRGFKVDIERREAKGHSIAEALQQEAFEMGADLLAVGAFGHSRAYDLVLGAVSYDLLREGRMPVLFSR